MDEPVTSSTGHRRRRWVVAGTLVVGAASVAVTLRLEPGDGRFLLGAGWMAAVWAVGGVLAGPVHVSEPAGARRALVTGVLAGTTAVALCTAGGLVVARIDVLREPAEQLLDHAGDDTLLVVVLTLVNGVAEEIFFRGALHDALLGLLPAHLSVPVATGIYALTVVGSGVVLLVLAAVLLGAAAAVLRQRTGGVLAPIVLHVIWSAGMLALLPPVLTTGG